MKRSVGFLPEIGYFLFVVSDIKELEKLNCGGYRRAKSWQCRFALTFYEPFVLSSLALFLFSLSYEQFLRHKKHIPDCHTKNSPCLDFPSISFQPGAFFLVGMQHSNRGLLHNIALHKVALLVVAIATAALCLKFHLPFLLLPPPSRVPTEPHR